MAIGYSRQTRHWEPGHEFVNGGASLPLKLEIHISDRHYCPDPRVPNSGSYLGLLSEPADAIIDYVRPAIAPKYCILSPSQCIEEEDKSCIRAYNKVCVALLEDFEEGRLGTREELYAQVVANRLDSFRSPWRVS